MTTGQSPIKYVLSAAPLLLISLFSFGQTKAPYEMILDGVKVIVQPSGNEIVQVQTMIRGGVQNYNADQQGIESLAMRALTECGTVKDDKNSFRNKLDKVGAFMYGTAGMDYSSLTLNCIQGDFDGIWPLYVDALTTPLFDEKEFERIKQDAVNSLKSRASQPDYAIRKLARETAFQGGDHAKAPEGTEATVSGLTAAQTKAYYTSVLTRSRLLVVVVGEIDSAVLVKDIRLLLAAIPAGQPFNAKRETFAPKNNSFIEEKKDLATNYIQGVSASPQPGSPDYDAFALAWQMFYDRHFLEVRTNNGLSYAPIVFVDQGWAPSANIFVSTKDPNKYISVLKGLLDKTRRDGFTEDELRNMKTTYLTTFYYKQETNSAQASSLVMNEIVYNNWRRSLTMQDDIKKVTLSDVNKAFDKYISKIVWVYQGDTSKVTPSLYTNGIQPQKPPPSSLSNPKSN
jgi:zinc protease